MILTKEQLKEWMKDAHNCGCIYGDYDSCGNYWSEEVYHKDNKYYAIACLDGRPSTKFDLTIGYLEDQYELREIKKVQRIVDDWDYVE